MLFLCFSGRARDRIDCSGSRPAAGPAHFALRQGDEVGCTGLSFHKFYRARHDTQCRGKCVCLHGGGRYYRGSGQRGTVTRGGVDDVVQRVLFIKNVFIGAGSCHGLIMQVSHGRICGFSMVFSGVSTATRQGVPDLLPRATMSPPALIGKFFTSDLAVFVRLHRLLSPWLCRQGSFS